MAAGLRDLLVGDWWRYTITLLGTLMLAVGVGSVLIDGQLTGEELLQVSSLAMLCLLLIAVGARVAVEVRDRAQLFSILGWLGLGVMVLAVLGGWYRVVLDTVDTQFETALVFLSVLAAGALFGAIVGYYDVRVRTLVERAGREQARREFADEQRETLSSLNGILRHQILNDLSAISGRAELLESGKIGADAAAESILDHCEHVDDTVSRIETVVDALTHVSDTSPIPIEHAVRRATERVHEDYPDLRVDSDLPDNLAVPADELLHIGIGELLENTAVHTDESNVTVMASAGPETVVIEVSDDGPGVPISGDRLFEPNTRGPDSDSDGLGLFLTKLIVERYDGTIRLAEEGGSTFEVEIPTDGPAPGEPPE